MVSNSKAHRDVFQWVIKVIESSTNRLQLQTAKKLICLFELNYRNKMEFQSWIGYKAVLDTLVYSKELDLK